MKKLTFLIFVVPILLSACNTPCIKDSGQRVTHEQSVKEFDEIEVSGPVKLILHQDSTYRVKIAADSNIIDKIKVRVSGDDLEVKLDPKTYCGTDSIVIMAGIGKLESISGKDACMIYSDGRINLGNFKLNLSGNTDLNLNLNAAEMTTNIDGMAKLHLSGQAGMHKLKSKGNVKLEAFDFVVGIYDLNIEGTGKSNINVLNELNVKTSGESEIYYKGNPKNVKEKKTGMAKMEKVN